MPPGYTTTKQLTSNALGRQMRMIAVAGVGLLVLLLGGVVVLARRRSKTRARKA
jgi:membrane protein DedA with SNARE-associated domain